MSQQQAVKIYAHDINKNFSVPLNSKNNRLETLIYSENTLNVNDSQLKTELENLNLKVNDIKDTLLTEKIKVEDLDLLNEIVKVVENTQLISDTTEDNKLNVYVNKKNYGSRGNLLNNQTLTPSSSSSSVNVDEYEQAHIYYEDSNVDEREDIIIEVSLDGTNWDFYGRLYPVNNYLVTKRIASAEINLSGVQLIRITNPGPVLNNIVCSIIA